MFHPVTAVPATLEQLGASVQPAVLAGDRILPVPGPLGALLPGGGLQRGSVTVIDGLPGAGATSVLLHVLAAVTAAGEWTALVDGRSVVGGLAAAEAGVALERLGVVRGVPREQWAAVVAALLEGVALVAATVPRWARPGDARRLAARARERGAALLAVGGWPAEAALRLRAERTRWDPVVSHAGARTVRIAVAGRRSGRPATGDVVIDGAGRLATSTGRIGAPIALDAARVAG
jgi:RecA/RadA recombinase